MCTTSLGLHACKNTTQHCALGFVSFLCLLFQIGTSNCPKSSQISVPDGYAFQTHVLQCSCPGHENKQSYSDNHHKKKNPQNYFTQKQCFPLASFIKVIQTPFWNKHIYPPFKGDNSKDTFCTLVRHSTLYTVAYLSTVMDYFSNSSPCRSHCHLPFKIPVSPSTEPQSSLAGCSVLRDFGHRGIGPQVVPALRRSYSPNITWMCSSKVVQLRP